MKNYKKASVSGDERVELHDKLNLTGAEISVNTLPAGIGVPFVHAHKQNEEIYFVFEGKGRAEIDGENIELSAGDWIKISPSAKRQFFASSNSALKYVCIQTKENSLENYTATDAVIF